MTERADKRAWQGLGSSLVPRFHEMLAIRLRTIGGFRFAILTHALFLYSLEATRVKALLMGTVPFLVEHVLGFRKGTIRASEGAELSDSGSLGVSYYCIQYSSRAHLPNDRIPGPCNSGPKTPSPGLSFPRCQKSSVYISSLRASLRALSRSSVEHV
jgi:hypothetical protein